MLAIPLISAKCERVFSSAKHLVTDARNCLKADIIKANKCLKSWYKHPRPKALKQGVDPDVDNLYEEELTAKVAAKKDSNAQSNVDQEAGEEGEQEGQGNKGDAGDGGDEDDEDNKDDEGNKSQEEDEGNKEDTIKYIIVND